MNIVGSFAMWGGVFSSMDCLLIYYRQKDDPYNAIIAGAITGGVLAIRGIYILFLYSSLQQVVLVSHLKTQWWEDWYWDW